MGSNISTWNAIKEIRFGLADFKPPQGASYTLRDSGRLTVNAQGFTEGSGIIAALYDGSGAMLDCGSTDCEDGENILGLDRGLYTQSDKLKLFVWDMASFEGYFMREHNK